MVAPDASQAGERSELGRLMAGEGFRFELLRMKGIDNEPVFAINDPVLREQETCLVSPDAPSGDAAVDRLAAAVQQAIGRHPLPVVRFADGEYLFYMASMKCNGLYQQAESPEAMQAAFPAHYRVMRQVAASGLLAPLVFPGNVKAGRRSWRRLWKKPKGDDQARRFLDLAAAEGVQLTARNYVPFYAVYAYLSGQAFASSVDGRTVGVINSDHRQEACEAWFARRGSRPRLVSVSIPDRFVATGWSGMRAGVLQRLDPSVDLWMVGAGIGALEVCHDVATATSRPAIDSGHIVNSMNDLESKSNGPRLYTHVA
jgi:hypothetical protein